MKKNLTADSVKRLKPANKRLMIYDEKSRALALVIMPSGVKTWYLCRRIQGKTQQIKIGRYPDISLAQARQEAERMNSEISMGKIGSLGRSGVSFGDLMENYLESLSNRPTTLRDARSRNKNHLTGWHSTPAEKITYDFVARHHKSNGKEQPAVANRILSLVSCVFEHARGDLIPRATENPARGIKKHPENKRQRFLTGEEVRRFFEQIDETAKRSQRAADFFLMLLFTGQRAGKVRAIEWDDVDIPQRLWRIEKGKHGEAQTVHLTEPAIDILLRRQKSATGQWVFPANTKTGYYSEPRKAWSTLVQNAKLDNFRQHDLRHTLASWQAIHGASLLTIGASLGHKSTQATERCAHLTLQPVRESVDAAAAALQATRQDAEKPAIDDLGELTDEERKAAEEAIRKLRGKRK